MDTRVASTFWLLNDAAMNMGMQISLWDPASNYLEYIPRSGIATFMIIQGLIFWGTAMLFLTPFSNPIAMYNDSTFLPIFSVFWE